MLFVYTLRETYVRLVRSDKLATDVVTVMDGTALNTRVTERL